MTEKLQDLLDAIRELKECRDDEPETITEVLKKYIDGVIAAAEEVEEENDEGE